MMDHSRSRSSTGSALLAGLLSLAFFAPGPVPAGWTDADIGGPGQAGSATYDPVNGQWAVSGGGGDIWGTGDQFNFASMAVTGDCTISARVITQGNTDVWAKAGVMIRETNAAGASFSMAAITPGNGTIVQWRNGTGTGAAWPGAGATGVVPIYVRMVRAGNLFTGYYSPDGVTWTANGNVTITMAAGVLAGLAVTSHNNGVLSPCTFDNVVVTNGTGGILWPTPPPTNVQVQPGFNSMTITWNAVSGATSYTVYRLDPGATAPAPIGTTAGTTIVDNGVTYPNSYSYTVTATNPSIGTSAQSSPPVTATPLQPPISVNATTINVVEGGAPVVFNITVNQPLTAGQTINFTVTTNVPAEGQVASSGQPLAPAISAQTVNFQIMGPQAPGLAIPVRVYGVDDPFVDGNQAFTVTVSFTSTQANPFSGFTIPVINCTNVDNDTPGVVVSRTAGLVTSEGGGFDSFNVRLTTSPSAPLTLNIASSNLAEGTVSAGTFVFSGANYATGVNVTVTGVDDALLDFTVGYTILLGFQGGGAAEYAGIVPPNVSVNNLDNEVPPALDMVWGSAGCGLLGLEGLLPLLGAAMLARRRRRS